MKQVAIVGLSPSTHDDAPFEDDDWEVWGLPWDNDHWPYYDRAFDIHPLECIKEATPSFYQPNYLRRLSEDLRDLDLPLYMQEAYPEVPNAIRYPLEDVVGVVGDYFNSTIAYMLALAIFEGYDKIALWGVDLVGQGGWGHADEYMDERPNIEYLCGFAKGRGIEIWTPDVCPLLKFAGRFPLGKIVPHYGPRYGYLNKPGDFSELGHPPKDWKGHSIAPANRTWQ